MSTKNEVAVKIENVSKTFRLPHEKHTSMKTAFLSRLSQSKGYEIQDVLRDVSFEVKKGEFFGIVGRNGSGKSTLLKCMAGVYAPNRGKIHIDGKLVPFIELGVGFNPELSGRDNVYLNGALLGFSRKQMDVMYDDIVDFAELPEFMDQKLKNYSSGMQVRLAFSIAIRAKGDVLLLDEVLAVGDAAFQKKCNDYFYELKQQGRTVVLVTHNMAAVEQYCDRALLIDSGKVQKIGTPSEISQMYSNINVLESSAKNTVSAYEVASSIKVKANIEGERKNGLPILPADKKTLDLDLELDASKSAKGAILGIVIFNSRNIPVFATNTQVAGVNLNLNSKKNPSILRFCIDNIFTNDTHRISVTIRDKDRTEVLYTNDVVAQFVSYGRRHDYAVVSPGFSITAG